MNRALLMILILVIWILSWKEKWPKWPKETLKKILLNGMVVLRGNSSRESSSSKEPPSELKVPSSRQDKQLNKDKESPLLSWPCLLNIWCDCDLINTPSSVKIALSFFCTTIIYSKFFAYFSLLDFCVLDNLQDQYVRQGKVSDGLNTNFHLLVCLSSVKSSFCFKTLAARFFQARQ